jgi:hypothetical protein
LYREKGKGYKKTRAPRFRHGTGTWRTMSMYFELKLELAYVDFVVVWNDKQAITFLTSPQPFYRS